MILVEINEGQRKFMKTAAVLLWEGPSFWTLWNRLCGGVEYRGQYMCEITEEERTQVIEHAHELMEAMRAFDMNAWLTEDYVNLENLSYALYIDCAI